MTSPVYVELPDRVFRLEERPSGVPGAVWLCISVERGRPLTAAEKAAIARAFRRELARLGCFYCAMTAAVGGDLPAPEHPEAS